MLEIIAGTATAGDSLIDNIPCLDISHCGLHHAFDPALHFCFKHSGLFLRSQRNSVHAFDLADGHGADVEDGVGSLRFENHVVSATVDVAEFHAHIVGTLFKGYIGGYALSVSTPAVLNSDLYTAWDVLR